MKPELGIPGGSPAKPWSRTERANGSSGFETKAAAECAAVPEPVNRRSVHVPAHKPRAHHMPARARHVAAMPASASGDVNGRTPLPAGGDCALVLHHRRAARAEQPVRPLVRCAQT